MAKKSKRKVIRYMSKHKYKVAVKGKSSNGTTVTASLEISADTAVQAEKEAKQRRSNWRDVTAVAKPIK